MWTMAIRRTGADLIKLLRSENLLFSAMVLIHEGVYTTFDADWNYKDVPHLHYLHKLVEAYPSMISDDISATINMQNILGFRFPMSVFNYHSGPNTQTYYTTLFGFILIVETRWESLADIKTCVTTTYNIGSTWLLRWAHPIIRFLIQRNYQNLMSEDIPMRERRGELRKLGYRFKSDVNPHSFLKTMAVHEKNVVFPDLAIPHPIHVDLSQQLNQVGAVLFLGGTDHYGVRLVRLVDSICAFPRLCDHEGACLDRGDVKNKNIHCPWHGKIIRPIFSFLLDQQEEQKANSDFLYAELFGKMLHIEFKAASKQDVPKKSCYNTSDVVVSSSRFSINEEL